MLTIDQKTTINLNFLKGSLKSLPIKNFCLSSSMKWMSNALRVVTKDFSNTKKLSKIFTGNLSLTFREEGKSPLKYDPEEAMTEQ